jgi:hypothetical protein
MGGNLENILVSLSILQEPRDTCDGRCALPRSTRNLSVGDSCCKQTCCLETSAQCQHLVECRNVAEEVCNIVGRPALLEGRAK